MKQKMKISLMVLAAMLFTSPAYAACTLPDGAAGDMIYNSDHNVAQYCNGTDWIAMGGAGDGGDNLGNHVATQALGMGGFKITGAADPTAPQDAATKAYVDANAGGGVANTIYTEVALPNSTAPYTIEASVSPTGIYILSGLVGTCSDGDNTSLQVVIGGTEVGFAQAMTSGSYVGILPRTITMIMDGTNTYWYTNTSAQGLVTGGLWDGTIKKNNTGCTTASLIGGARIK